MRAFRAHWFIGAAIAAFLAESCSSPETRTLVIYVLPDGTAAESSANVGVDAGSDSGSIDAGADIDADSDDASVDTSDASDAHEASVYGTGPCPNSGAPMVRAPEGYCIDTREPTRAEWDAFVASPPDAGAPPAQCANNILGPENGCVQPNSDPRGCVDWCDAEAFCRAMGKRLCGGVEHQIVPLGGDTSPGASEWVDACLHPYGISGMNGNNLEWTAECGASGCTLRGIGTKCVDANTLAPIWMADAAWSFRCCAD